MSLPTRPLVYTQSGNEDPQRLADWAEPGRVVPKVDRKNSKVSCGSGVAGSTPDKRRELETPPVGGDVKSVAGAQVQILPATGIPFMCEDRMQARAQTFRDFLKAMEEW